MEIKCTEAEKQGLINNVEWAMGESFPCLMTYSLGLANKYLKYDCPLYEEYKLHCEKCLNEKITWIIEGGEDNGR